MIKCGNGKFLQKKQKLFINNELFLTADIGKERYLECFQYNYKNNEKKNKIYIIRLFMKTNYWIKSYLTIIIVFYHSNIYFFLKILYI